MSNPIDTPEESNRAVIPIVGQVILTTLIFAAVLGAATVALPELTDRQQSIQQDIATDLLVTTDERLETVHKTPQPANFTQTAPRGTFQLGGSQTTINVTNTTTGTSLVTTSSVMEFRTGEKALAYEAGLITTPARTQAQFPVTPDQSSLSPPSSDTVYTIRLTEVQVNTTEQVSRGTTYGLELTATRDGPARTAAFDPASTGDVIVRVTTPYPSSWARYFDNHPAFEAVSITGDTVTADVTTTAEIRITVYPVAVQTN